MNIYLHSCSAITAQPTFGGVEGVWVPIGTDAVLLEPDYKAYIAPAMLRRMSKVLRMSVTCATDAVSAASLERTDAVIVGTGLGCVRDTLRFMDDMHQGHEGVLSPTAFIQSTHNSMAGQIALSLGIKGYNLTHVQGMVSFEMAVADAMGYLSDYPEHTVLLGAMDEQTDELRSILGRLAQDLGRPMPILGEGAALFVASGRAEGAVCSIAHASTHHQKVDRGYISKVLIENDLNDVDVIIGPDEFSSLGRWHIDASKYLGLSFSLSGLSTALAFGLINGQVQLSTFRNGANGPVRSVAVVTTFGHSAGLVVLEKV